jgi:pumilio RNA-binding family
MFVIDELRQGAPGGVAQAARHRFGCRILQRLLEHCQDSQVAPVVEDLMAEPLALASHKYGNYVMQHVLEFGRPEVVSRLTYILGQHAPHMAAGGHIGAVVDKALAKAKIEHRQFLVSALLHQPEQLAIMSCSRWGHRAVEEALNMAGTAERSRACTELFRRTDKLRSCRYGRAISRLITVHQDAAAGVLAN